MDPTDVSRKWTTNKKNMQAEIDFSNNLDLFGERYSIATFTFPTVTAAAIMFQCYVQKKKIPASLPAKTPAPLFSFDLAAITAAVKIARE